jgi:hypothetical protein
MKNATIVILLLMIIWFSWKHFTETPPQPKRLTTIQTKEIYIVPSEKYGQDLRNIADEIISPLDSDSPNPVAKLTEIGGLAKADLRNGEITEDDATVILGLCSNLWRLNKRREHYETEYRSILTRHIPVIGGGRISSERKRQYLIDNVFREWANEVRQYRSEVTKGLAILRDKDRQKDFDNTP